MNSQTVPEPVETQYVIKSVSMYPEQWIVVEEINKQFDFRSLSLALRFVVNEYRRMKAQAELETN